MFTKFLAVVLVTVCTLQVREIEAGNNRPYGVSLNGVEGAGRPEAGFAGSGLVAPLASEGFNSPNQRYTQNNAFPGNPSGIGFGGFGWRNSQPSSGYGGGSSGSSGGY